VLHINRIAKVVKGGRRFRFRAAVIVGDKQRHVGFAIQKGKDVQAAIEKAVAAARKRLTTVVRDRGTIPHEIRAHYRGADVLLKPAPPGAGIIAGGPLRALASLAGIVDLSAKIMGSHNKVNVTRAALKALTSLASVKETSVHHVSKRRATEPT
jgi:small subunit ribosomal protein S5